MKSLTTSLLLLFLASATWAETPIDKAKKFIEVYQERGNNFDPKLADLYADEAKIVNTTLRKDDRKDVIKYEGKNFKEQLRKGLPTTGKMLNDKNTFSDITYTEENGRVRVTATRFNQRKNCSSPHSFLIGPAKSGAWFIYEELREIKP
jgi:exopolysaccharide biosynthesis protein